MKKTFQNGAIFLLTIIILAIGIGMIINEFNVKEGFSSPMINQIYNPVLRKVRNYTNDKIESFSNSARVFLKKYRIV
jgi:hypothetical protein